MITYITLLLIGTLAGTFGAMLGLGGGIIMLPATQHFLHYNTIMSVGTTLFAVIFTSLSGAWGHFRSGHIRIRSSLYVGLGGSIGVLLGSFVFKEFLSTSIDILQTILGILFVLMALRLGRESYQGWRQDNLEKDRIETTYNRNESALGLVGLGLSTGIITGALGLGGGFIMVPGMMWLFSVPPVQAVGTTLLAMFPIALLGGMIKLYQGYVYLVPGLILGVGTAVGAQFGAYLSGKINANLMKLAFAIIFLITALSYL